MAQRDEGGLSVGHLGLIALVAVGVGVVGAVRDRSGPVEEPRRKAVSVVSEAASANPESDATAPSPESDPAEPPVIEPGEFVEAELRPSPGGGLIVEAGDEPPIVLNRQQLRELPVFKDPFAPGQGRVLMLPDGRRVLLPQDEAPILPYEQRYDRAGGPAEAVTPSPETGDRG